DGDCLIVGAPSEGPGAAYVFRRDLAGDFLLEQKLVSPVASGLPGFGASVALSSGRAYIGSPNEGIGGRAYTFVETTPGSWEVDFELLPPAEESAAALGASITVVQGRPVVGAPGASAFVPSQVVSAGLAFTYELDLEVCLTDVLGAPQQSPADELGAAVALIGDTALVGLPFDDALGTNSGGVALYGGVDGLWAYQGDLLVPSLLPLDLAGASLAATTEQVVVGAPAAPSAFSIPGRIFVADRDPLTGSIGAAAELAFSQTSARDRLGASVASQGPWIVAGAPDSGSLEGLAGVWRREDQTGGFDEVQVLSSTDPSDGPTAFGASVAITEDFIAVGAPFDSGGPDGEGSVTVFEQTNGIAPVGAAFFAAEDPVFNGVVDPVKEVTWAGDGVVMLDDLDGNGFAEIAVGSLFGDALGDETGGVDIIFMGPNATPIGAVDLLADPSLWPTLTAGDRFGVSIAWGQFDGDPENELAVGAPNQSPGALFVADIDSTGTPSNVRVLNAGSFPAFPPGGSNGGSLGNSMVNLGDLDGDGIDELAVSGVGGTTGGSARVLFFDSQTQITNVTFTPATSLGIPGAAFERFGEEVEFINDPGGPGGVLVVTDSGSLLNGVSDPSAHFFRVDISGQLTMINSWFSSEVPDYQPSPSIFTTSFGWGCTAADDIDGDGQVEVLIADYLSSASPLNPQVRGVFLVFALDQATGGTYQTRFDVSQPAFSAIGPFNRAGRSAEWLGDIDGDGLGELMLSGLLNDPSDGLQPGFLIVKVDEGWASQQQPLFSPFASSTSGFGTVLELDGTTLAVGAPGLEFTASDPGSVAIYDLGQSPPQLVQVLTAASGQVGDRFGSSLSLMENSLLVGAPGGFGPQGPVPMVTVFERLDESSDFLEIRTLEGAALSGPGDRFGTALARNDTSLLVGAPLSDLSGQDSGSVIVYSLDGSCPQVLASADFVSLQSGGTQIVTLEAGEGLAGSFYLALASLTEGFTPLAPSLQLPFALDPLTTASLTQANSSAFVNTFGLLDGAGSTTCSFALPPGLNPSLAGESLTSAFLLLDPVFLSPFLVSDPSSVELVDG
ncbi:MAG: hypothetical protein AAFZ65_12015, partial [Planctomycetota bacterium]